MYSPEVRRYVELCDRYHLERFLLPQWVRKGGQADISLLTPINTYTLFILVLDMPMIDRNWLKNIFGSRNGRLGGYRSRILNLDDLFKIMKIMKN